MLASLIIGGGVAGGLGAVLLLGREVDKEFIIALIAAGYAGTDFIEGMIKTKMPK